MIIKKFLNASGRMNANVIRMAIPSNLMPLLKEFNLVAFLVNEDWILIRRKTYLDIFVEDQPYSSVEVLMHSVTLVS